MKNVKNPWHSLGEISLELFDERVAEQLRNVWAGRLSVREQERTMIAREIHDELGQLLVRLKTDVSLMNNRLNDRHEGISLAEFSDEISSMAKLIDTALQAMKRLITELRPEILENLGLKAAIKWEAQEFQARTNIQVKLRSDLETMEVADHDCATAVFRMFQEALANIERHAKASRVEATLQENREFFIMQVKDDGIGINEIDLSKDASFGLIGLRERAFLFHGDVDIQGAPNEGTTVTVRLPLAICKSSNKKTFAK